MLLGQQLGTYAPSDHGNHWDTTLAAAQACEQAGLDSVWLPDHFMFPDRAQPEKEVPVFDCFVALGAMAASTSRIRLGELVVGVPYRNPALLAKMLTTLDVIAHGRTIAGLARPGTTRSSSPMAGHFPRCATAWPCWKRRCRSSTG